jgi:DHA1 family tetracycline resistance protein-like MFS transporter
VTDTAVVILTLVHYLFYSKAQPHRLHSSCFPLLNKTMNYKLILPVLFLEYLSISIARSILPGLIVNEFGSYSYLIIGLIETLKGLLAFIFCPIIGKISDEYGRKYCLLITMIGTTFPICFLAYNQNLIVYTFLIGFSGIFAATFALTFAYISDIVEKEQCAAAFGLALATFGLSFTVGPLLGGFIAANYGEERVFRISNILVIGNILYILFILPESNKKHKQVCPFRHYSVVLWNEIN